MMRVVFDTNIVVSGLLWEGAPAQAVNAAFDERIILLSSEEMLAELDAVFHRPKIAKRLAAIGKTPDQFLENYRQLVEVVTPASLSVTLRDPKDVMVITCAVGGKAYGIVSGDQDLLTLGVYHDIPIWTVHAFLERLNET